MNISPFLKTIIESIEALSLEDQALLFEQLYRRNLLVLRRLLAIAPEIHSPDWAKSENVRSLSFL